MINRTRTIARLAVVASLAATALTGAAASPASALSCPSGSRYATTGDVKNTFTPAVVIHINWCYSTTTHKVTAHEWYRNYINGNGWNFNSYASPARSGGNGYSYFKLRQTGYFWGGRWLCVDNGVSVNGQGNWAQENNSWIYC